MNKKLLFITTFLLPLSLGWGNGANAQGNFSWGKQIGGTNSDQPVAVGADDAGNVYTLGAFQGTADMDPGPATVNLNATGGASDQDIFITKLDASGNFVWAKQVGGLNSDRPGCMVVDHAGNTYITGTFQATVDFDPGPSSYPLVTAGANNDPFVLKLDASGNFVWARQFKELVTGHYGMGVGIAIDPAGNVYASGAFSGTTDFNLLHPDLDTISPVAGTGDGFQDLFICKMDNAGNFKWVKHISGGTGESPGVYISKTGGINVDHSGNVFSVGDFKGTTDFDPNGTVFNMEGSAGVHASSEDMYVSKWDSSGSFLWAKKIVSETSVYPYGIVADAIGNVFITGDYMGTTDFNPGIAINNMTAVGDNDIFICKLDTAGNFGWIRSMGGNGSDWGGSITLDTLGNIYTTGGFSDTVDFDPSGGGSYKLSTTGNFGEDAFISKLNEAGTFLWAKHIGGASDFTYDQGVCIAVDNSHNTYVIGSFADSVDLDPNAGVTKAYAYGGAFDYDVFVVKLNDTVSTVGIPELTGTGANSFNVYPNPNTGTFNLTMNLETDSKLNIEIVDITGQLVKNATQSKLKSGINTMVVDGSELSNGIYFVKIYNDSINKTLKFIINK